MGAVAICYGLRMRVAVIKHHEIDDAGFIADAFAARGAELSVHMYPDDGPLPALDGLDHIVVLGAAWSVYDHEKIGHWIGAELDWLQAADAAAVPVLGICFGAQALCAALGGEVRPAARPEIGWTLVEPDPRGPLLGSDPRGSSLGSAPQELRGLPPGPAPGRPAAQLEAGPWLVEAGPWLEFHSDECVLPAAATPLARTDVCVQAFIIGQHLGVQFHPEVDGAQLDRWLQAGGDAGARAAGQDPAELLARTIAEEPLAKLRADRLVAIACALAAPATAQEALPR
jgi:GMP synthase-like glutamine amidotransferase